MKKAEAERMKQNVSNSWSNSTEVCSYFFKHSPPFENSKYIRWSFIRLRVKWTFACSENLENIPRTTLKYQHPCMKTAETINKVFSNLISQKASRSRQDWIQYWWRYLYSLSAGVTSFCGFSAQLLASYLACQTWSGYLSSDFSYWSSMDRNAYLCSSSTQLES